VAEIKIFFHGKESQTLEENMDFPTKQRDFGNFGTGHPAVFDSSSFISVFNQRDAQNLFHDKFYFMPLHASSTCARSM